MQAAPVRFSILGNIISNAHGTRAHTTTASEMGENSGTLSRGYSASTFQIQSKFFRPVRRHEWRVKGKQGKAIQQICLRQWMKIRNSRLKNIQFPWQVWDGVAGYASERNSHHVLNAWDLQALPEASNDTEQ
jgi:hypothetical protein